MIKLTQDTTRKLLAIHGWSGIVLGLLLYVVIVTGTAAVLADELAQWSSPSRHAELAPFGQDIDRHVRQLAARTDSSLHEDILLFPGAGGRLHLLFHQAATKPDGSASERGIEYEVEPSTGIVLARHEGWLDDLPLQRESEALARFFIDLHVRLHVPNPWGLLLTGLLGLVMMIAAVTGLLVHRHLLKELFTLRLFRDSLLRRRDLHVAAGSWNLPFAFLLAFTGSFFSFASAVGIPALAMVAFQGDQEALIAAVVGGPPPVDDRAMSTGNLDALFADARQRTGADAAFAVLSHYGRADSRLIIQSQPGEGRMIGMSAVYAPATSAATPSVIAPATAAFIGLKPIFGLQPSLGGDLAALMTPLHFGSFAGIFSKMIWLALGAAGAYVTFSGLMLWCRRREAEPGWQRFERATCWIGLGLPLSLLMASHAFFLLRGGAFVLQTQLLTVALLTLLGSGLLYGLLGGKSRLALLNRLHSQIIGALLIGLPIVRWLSGGPNWLDAMATGQPVVPGMDLGLLMLGLLVLWATHSRSGAST